MLMAFFERKFYFILQNQVENETIREEALILFVVQECLPV
ncbi:hypothetical protein J2X31_001777 [Flavobacterium arsenatis]|uniref:Uncharacterized protein n=1 Tax=Flavobacterium arsenatis TaxID=1484332 RepID=A0ABU1TP69_9FLAO|nr:hypothetical protein [Flavobacterium arsenatis]